MKFSILILSSLLFFSCNSNKEKLMPVSFEVTSINKNIDVVVAYTNDTDSLWLNEEWIKAISNKMENLSSTYSTVLLFNGEKHTPDVVMKGMNYPSFYDQYMVCGFWTFPNGSKKFCYGGVKSDGNFKICE